MDVDPVVGEEILAGDDERDSEEVAVAETAGRLEHVVGRPRVGHRDDVAQGQRRDHSVRLVRGAARIDARRRDRRAISIRSTGVSSRTSPPSSSIRRAIASHIWPGP